MFNIPTVLPGWAPWVGHKSEGPGNEVVNTHGIVGLFFRVRTGYQKEIQHGEPNSFGRQDCERNKSSVSSGEDRPI